MPGDLFPLNTPKRRHRDIYTNHAYRCSLQVGGMLSTVNFPSRRSRANKIGDRRTTTMVSVREANNVEARDCNRLFLAPLTCSHRT